MENKWRVFIFLAIIVILFVLFFLIKKNPNSLYLESYSDDPKTWVDSGEDIKEINVEKITQGEGYVDFDGVQLRKEEIATVFDYDGYYKGNYFRREYSDLSGRILMSIGPDMKPGDGVIEGFMVEKFENGELIVNIFLDEDWKEQIGITNIFWGKSYENEKEFGFEPVSDGIYMDQIIDDEKRFSDDFKMHFGGVIVGDLTREDDVNSTLIRLV